MDRFISIYMPYCLERQPCGRYAVLNRHYKPLGVLSKDYVDYAKVGTLAKIRMTAKDAIAISFDFNPRTSRVYLYDSGSHPLNNAQCMQSYMARLSILAKKKGKAVKRQPWFL